MSEEKVNHFPSKPKKEKHSLQISKNYPRKFLVQESMILTLKIKNMLRKFTKRLILMLRLKNREKILLSKSLNKRKAFRV
jgi:hypothetical protein